MDRVQQLRIMITAVIVLVFAAAGVMAQESSNMSFLGNFGKGDGQSKAVFAQGTLTYFSVGEKLKMADFSNPAQPFPLGTVSLEATIEDLVKAGNYVYLVAGSKAYVVNVQNPLTPSVSGSFEFTGFGEGVASKSTNIYVAAGDGGLRVIDASNPSSPNEISFMDTIGYAEGVSISGDYAYVATGSQVRIINISNPSSLVYVGSVAEPEDWYQSVTARGNFLYIADYSYGIQIVDVTNPAAPVVRSKFPTGERAARIQLDGNFAYVANGDSLKIVNVTNPAAPSAAGALKVTDRALSVGIGVGHVFIADRNAGLHVINIANPSAPSLVHTVATAAPASGSAYGVFYAGNKAYVAYGSAGLRVIDVTVPSAPVMLGEIPLEGDSRQVVVKDGYAFVAARDGGVRVVNATNPAALVELAPIATPRARGIAISGNYVYVAASDSGMAVIDVTNAAAPVWITSASANYGEGVTVTGNIAAVSTYSNVILYDVTNPAAPVEKGETGALTVGTAGMFVSGGYLYVPDFDTLKVYNISDLNAPSLVTKVSSGASWDASVVVDGIYAYVAAEENGVRVFDVSNPASISEAAYFKSSASARGLATANGYVYVAEKEKGLSVLKNDLITGVEEEAGILPRGFELEQNYPNPFNPETKISFILKSSGKVTLKVYNVVGQEAAVLVNGEMPAGSHSVRFSGAGLPSGVYFYELTSGSGSTVKKMMLLK